MDEYRQITLRDGRTLAYAEYGDPDGAPILFSHGWPSSRLQARCLDELAIQKNLRILAPDRPGIGASSAKEKRAFTDWADDIANFLDELHIENIPLYGVSGGAPFALACSVYLSERITKTAIVCGAPPLDQSARKHMHPAYRILGSSRNLRRAIIPVLIPTARWMVNRGAEKAPLSWLLKTLPKEDRNALTNSIGWDMISRSFLESVRKGGRNILQEGELYLNEWNFDPSNIQIPIHFWHGYDDANLPFEAAKKLASGIPKAETTWLKNQGHYSIALQTRNDVLDWLK